MDEIRIDNLQVFAHHGVYAFETEQGQDFYVNAVLHTDLRKAGLSDELEDSTNYGEICEFITEYLQDNTFHLIEAAAEHTVQELLLQFPLIRSVTLELRKPDAPINLPFESVSVQITRSWHDVYLSFGSNIGEKEQYIRDGLAMIENHPLCKMLEISNLISTKPYGPVEQDDFLNGACHIQTLLPPEELLDFLHEVEKKANRTRDIHWGPRTLDLDILFYDDITYSSESLTIPHVDMHNRAFVLEPMNQIAPYKLHPIFGLTILKLLEQLHQK